MKALAVVAAFLLLTSCSSSSLTVSETGKVTAMVEGLEFGDFKTTVRKMKDAIDAACGSSAMATSGSLDADAWAEGLNEEQAALVIPVLERINANAEQLKQLRDTLEGWLPSHSFAWNGKCD